jgi:GntR family negative regulator for fad regulon and positive regulator of fabA
MDWQPIQKPAEIAESRMLDAILSGHFPINSTIPGERELAEQIGITRPTLREALQRLARDGWLDIQQGKPTRVRDYWREGSLAVLSALAQSPTHRSPDFVVHLLDLRVLLAPAYARQAVQSAPEEIIALLDGYADLEDSPADYARADWELHSLLVEHSSNPVFQLLLNGFQSLYLLIGEQYFSFPECRHHSRGFYQALLKCARGKAECEAEALTRRVMEESLALAREMLKENS